MYQNRIGNKIRDLRMARNMTQAELGQVVGVSMQAVSKWERGGIPDIGILIMLADYFRISLDELLGRTAAPAASTNDQIYHAVFAAKEEDAFEVACDACWAAMKGITGIPAIENMGYSASGSANPENSRCRISTNSGIAYGIIGEDAHMLSLMPEPEDGFSTFLGSLEDSISLFRFLSDPDTLKLFRYIGTKSHTLFSRSLAQQDTGIHECKLTQIFQAFTERGWLTCESADTDSGPVTLYRSLCREPFIFFQIFARELTVNPRYWYLSSISRRTKPLIQPQEPEDE